MQHGKAELEHGYEQVDPWGYKTSAVDIERKRLIVGICELFRTRRAPFAAALDVGCGEGWITQDLPAVKLFGYEISEKARARFPATVKDVTNLPSAQAMSHVYGPGYGFDLVTCMGALYAHYDYARLIDVIRDNARDVIVISGIKDWELPLDLETAFDAKQVFEAEFPYRRPESEYTQQVRVFRK